MSDLNISALDPVIKLEHDYVVQTYVRPDFVLERGEGMTLYDTEGRAYQDWVAGIAVNALGYSDEGVASAITSGLQSGVMHVSNLYHTAPHAHLAKMLVEHSFADRVFFSNSGTEANEAAIKFARKLAYKAGKSEKTQIVAFKGAFHGRTMGSLALTPKERYQKPFQPLMPDVVIAEFNNIDSALAAIGPNTAAVFVEPIQGEGGIHVASGEFLQAVREACDTHQVLLIFDEVQCGVGRTGNLWAHVGIGVQPDIMTLAKPLAAGLPIGAVLVRQFVAEALEPGDHGSTFAGGPLVTHVAAHVLERVSDAAFLQQVTEVGEYLRERLEEINSPLVKEVRGRGLMNALELTVEVGPVVQAGYKEGLLLVNAGTHVIRLVPPLIATRSDVDYLVEKLTRILGQMAS